jgi:hypothetical protein
MAFVKMTNRATGYAVQEADWDAMTGNFDALNDFFHVPLFPFSSGLAPASGLQAAAYSVVQSSGAGTIKPEWPILALDSATDEGRIWNGTLPRSFGVTAVLSGQFYMPTVTSGTFMPSCQIACWSDGDTGVASKVMASANSPSAVTVPGTALTIETFSITLTNFDSGAAIDSFSLAFFRDVSEDTAAEDVYLKRLDLFFALTSTTV